MRPRILCHGGGQRGLILVAGYLEVAAGLLDALDGGPATPGITTAIIGALMLAWGYTKGFVWVARRTLSVSVGIFARRFPRDELIRALTTQARLGTARVAKDVLVIESSTRRVVMKSIAVPAGTRRLEWTCESINRSIAEHGTVGAGASSRCGLR